MSRWTATHIEASRFKSVLAASMAFRDVVRSIVTAFIEYEAT